MLAWFNQAILYNSAQVSEYFYTVINKVLHYYHAIINTHTDPCVHVHTRACEVSFIGSVSGPCASEDLQGDDRSPGQPARLSPSPPALRDLTESMRPVSQT